MNQLKPNLRLLNTSDNSNNFNDEFQKNLPSFSNDKLCEVIVAFRYLGTMKEEALISMTELAKRREEGDTFPFENKIETLLNDLPKINLDIDKILKSYKI